MKKENPIKAIETPKLATYNDVASQWIKDNPTENWADVINFAKHLDSFKTLNSQLQILALQKTLETYIEFYNIIKPKISDKILGECLSELKSKHIKR